MPNITYILISLPITYKITLAQYCNQQQHWISVPYNCTPFLQKKQNTTLGIVKSAIFLIYEEGFFTDAYFTLETTRLVFIVRYFQQPHLGLSLVKFLFDLFVTLPNCAQLSIVYLITIPRILVELLESVTLYIYNTFYVYTINTKWNIYV